MQALDCPQDFVGQLDMLWRGMESSQYSYCTGIVSILHGVCFCVHEGPSKLPLLPSEVVDQILGTLKRSWQARPSRLAKDEVGLLPCTCIAGPSALHRLWASTPADSSKDGMSFSGSLSLGRARWISLMRLEEMGSAAIRLSCDGVETVEGPFMASKASWAAADASPASS